MADFKKSFAITMGNEGLYSNDPDDPGGETYCGISRVFHPSWQGWRIIDSLKKRLDFPKCLKTDAQLQTLVEQLYKAQYWDVFIADQISNQDIANELFDTGVNLHPIKATIFLQTSLNCLNRNGELYPDLVVDGQFGPTTLKALNIYLKADDPFILLTAMNSEQGHYYIENMRKSPTQEKYARGWLKRVQLTKNANIPR